MSLTILSIAGENPFGGAFVDYARKKAAGGHVVVLVPSFAQALEAQKVLADAGVGLGVEVSTPRSWAHDLWDLWGNGRRVVDGAARTVLLTNVAQSHAASSGSAAPTSGTVRLLARLADKYLPWIDDALATRGMSLTPAERETVTLLQEYERQLRAWGLMEASQCLCELPQALRVAGAPLPQVLLAGFDELPRAERTMLLGLAHTTSLDVLVSKSPRSYGVQARDMVDSLLQEATGEGISAGQLEGPSEDSPMRNPELQDLLRVLFSVGDARVKPQGSVCMLQASGPLAEAELVAGSLADLAAQGLVASAVVVPDVPRAWRELAPKLVARGISVKANLLVPALSCEAGRAFMGYVRTVANLVELNKTWPPVRQTPSGPCEQVGDMSWWPPQELTDFLLHDMSHVERQKAYALDIAWRQDRLLSPAVVLSQLQSAKATSDAVERATRELLRGRLGSAASKLLAPYVLEDGGEAREDAHPSPLAAEETKAVLAAVLGVANTLKELGVTADPSAADHVSLASLVSQAELALQTARVTLRPAAAASPQRGCAQLLGRTQAATLPPASVDVAVVCGLTSQEMSLSAAADEFQGIVESLALDTPSDTLATQRTLFHRLCALPRERLLLERTLFQADAHEAYPAVMLTELLGAYEGSLDARQRAEDDARANLAARGKPPAPMLQERVAPAGKVDDSLRRLVIVPQEGKAELEGGLPVLSASQIESYLECPLKWFSLRRLRLGNTDAGFGPLEMGTFAHRVLELTFAQLFQEGRAALSQRDPQGLEHAQQVLNQVFLSHLEHQHMRQGGHPAYQALIAHSAWEESQVDRLRTDLTSALEYMSGRLWGYTPYAFEWGFGRGKSAVEQGGLPSMPVAHYAGVRVTGTVDRIDINGQGQAVIIDYKHKGPAGFFAEYAAFTRTREAGEGFVLPRRIQALMYAQIVRRAFPNLRVVGALYLGTRGGHELAGAVEEAQADAIFGGKLGPRRADRVVIEQNDLGLGRGADMEALLDETEALVARKVKRLAQGHIEAEPLDDAACLFCPVANCERRLTR